MDELGGNRLPMIADTVRREHEAAQQAARAGLDHALACGDALIEAKALVRHGEWSAWLLAHAPALSERTAQQYMQLARNRERLEPQRVAGLSLRSAAKLLGGSENKKRQASASRGIPEIRAEAEAELARLKAAVKAAVREGSLGQDEALFERVIALWDEWEDAQYAALASLGLRVQPTHEMDEHSVFALLICVCMRRYYGEWRPI